MAPVVCRLCRHFATPFLTIPCYLEYCAIVTSVSKTRRACATEGAIISLRLCRGSLFLRHLQGKRGADERTRTAYPCSLRVIHQALHGCAEACKHRISKRLSLLRVAACCTVLRSRWYQSGINVTLHPRGSRAPTKARARRTSALRFGQALQRVRIRNINLSVPSLHGTRFPEHAERPRNRLTVRSHHAG
jgi:hypothetical protein